MGAGPGCCQPLAHWVCEGPRRQGAGRRWIGGRYTKRAVCQSVARSRGFCAPGCRPMLCDTGSCRLISVWSVREAHSSRRPEAVLAGCTAGCTHLRCWLPEAAHLRAARGSARGRVFGSGEGSPPRRSSACAAAWIARGGCAVRGGRAAASVAATRQTCLRCEERGVKSSRFRRAEQHKTMSGVIACIPARFGSTRPPGPLLPVDGEPMIARRRAGGAPRVAASSPAPTTWASRRRAPPAPRR